MKKNLSCAQYSPVGSHTKHSRHDVTVSSVFRKYSARKIKNKFRLFYLCASSSSSVASLNRLTIQAWFGTFVCHEIDQKARALSLATTKNSRSRYVGNFDRIVYKLIEPKNKTDINRRYTNAGMWFRSFHTSDFNTRSAHEMYVDFSVSMANGNYLAAWIWSGAAIDCDRSHTRSMAFTNYFRFVDAPFGRVVEVRERFC